MTDNEMIIEELVIKSIEDLQEVGSLLDVSNIDTSKKDYNMIIELLKDVSNNIINDIEHIESKNRLNKITDKIFKV